MLSEHVAVYREDIRNRTDIARSAMHKANGPAVAKLGNKPVSNAEIMEKHGPVIKYPSLNGFMEYSEFVALESDLKIEYILKLCDKYDISIKEISKYLFNKGDDGLRSYLRNSKMERNDTVVTILSQCCPNKQRGKTKLEDFQNDIKAWKLEKKLSIDIPQTKKKEIKFMDYNAFLSSPVDYQIAFINNIITNYQVTSKYISVVLFEKFPNFLTNHFNRLKVNESIIKLPRKLTVNKIFMEEKEKKFREDVNIWKGCMEIMEPKSVAKLFDSEKAEIVEIPVKVIDIPEKDTEIVHRPKIGEGGFASKMDTPPIPTEDISEVETKSEPDPDPMEYHEFHFAVSGISKGLNRTEFEALANIIGNKRVKYELTVTEV